MEKKTHYFSGPGYKISAVIYVPDTHKPTDKHPGIVLCQGYTGLKEMALPAVASRFAQEGYVVLNFDYRGFGESEGPRYRLIPLEQVEDIINGVSYLQTRSEVDPEKIGVWGTSFGGANAPYVASSDHRIKCTVSNLGIGDGERWLHCLRREWEWQEFLGELKEDRKRRALTGRSKAVHPYEIMQTTPEGWKFWEESIKTNPERAEIKVPLEVADAIIQYRPETVVHRLKSPVLYISAELDCLTPLQEQLSLYQNSPEPKRHVIFPDVDHHGIYKEPHFSKLIDLSIGWFRQYLPPQLAV